MLQGAQLRPAQAMTDRHRVNVTGPVEGPVMVFAHGFGCDQQVWAPLIAAFADRYRCVAFDTIGSGGSDISSYDARRYQNLDGYAADVLDLCEELDLRDVTLVAHSVSAMIAVLAAVEQPQRFAQLVLIAANPYYLDDETSGYRGGFTSDDLAEVGQALDSNYFTWAEAMAPVIMGVPEAPQLGEELAASFCRTDPDIARTLIKTSFATDCRALLPQVSTPTLLLQCRDDAMVPLAVGDHLRENIRGSQLVRLQARGHCPHISAPAETAAAMAQHLLPQP